MMKIETVTKSIEAISEDVTKTMTKSSEENNKALANLINKLLEIMNIRGILASYLLSPLSKVTNPERNSQFKLVTDRNSKRFNDLLLNKTVPVTLHDILLTFRDTNKNFRREGDLLKKITNKNYNVDHAKLLDKKLKFEYAKKKWTFMKKL